jgi:hypothetical protein
MRAAFSICAGALHGPLNSVLLCGLDVSGARPPHESGVIEIHAFDGSAGSFRAANRFVCENLPLLKSLLHAVSVRCERTDGSILIRPIPDDSDDIRLCQNDLPENGDETTSGTEREGGAT